MSTLGDNPEFGRPALGGFRAGGLAMRGGSARKGVVLYAKPIAFSIVNSARDDRQQREQAAFATTRFGGGSAGQAPRMQR